METLILEPNNYSSRAIELYKVLGPVWQGSVPLGSNKSVSLLVVRLAHRIDAKLISRFPALKAIATPTTGLTHIDQDFCAEKGIRVYSLLDCKESIEAVTSTSELTIGLLIALLRRVPEAHSDVIYNSRWDRDLYRSRQMSRLSIGIIGLGRIGGHVAHYARAFGMDVFAFDPYQPDSKFEDLGLKRYDLAQLLKSADVVSIHANLRNDNHGLLGQQELACMKPGAFLINTARGALVDEQAVAAALRSGRLAGVAFDVLSEEHGDEQAPGSPLIDAAREGANIIITPHIGGCTSDAMHITEECLANYVVDSLRYDNE